MISSACSGIRLRAGSRPKMIFKRSSPLAWSSVRFAPKGTFKNYLARRIHYGDAEARNIRGQASVREAVELMEEGIEVMPLPMPAALKETLQ